MAYPNLKQSVWLVALFWLIVVGFTMLVYLLGTIIDRDLLSNRHVDTFLILVSFVLVVVYGQRRSERPWPDILLFKKVQWRLYIPFAVSIVGLSIAISIVESVVFHLIPVPELFVKYFRDLVWKDTPFVSAFYNLAVQPSITEEVLFRGLILIGLLANQTRKRAILWSALLFALFHLNPWQFPGAFLLGLALALSVVRTGSLMLAIMGHALNNFLFLVAARYEIFGPVDEIESLVFLPWWLQLCGVALAVIGLRWFNQIAKGAGTPIEVPADQGLS